MLVIFGVSLGIAASEGVVRLFEPLSDFLWQWDPVIGMKLIPGKKGRSVKSGLYDVPVEVNSVGFRDREHPLEKPIGVRRIVLLGDSVVEALQVLFEESMTPLIEKRLAAAGINAEVMNFGVSGAGTAREYLTMRDYALKYQPDLVLLFFVANDFGDNTRELKGLSYIPYPRATEDGTLIRDDTGHPVFIPFADESSRLSSLTDLLRGHFKTYRLLRETIDRLPAFNDMWNQIQRKNTAAAAREPGADATLGLYEIYRRTPKPQWEKGRRVTEQLLVALQDLAAERSVEFAVVPVPSAWEVYPQRWEEILKGSPAMREADLDVDLPSRELIQFLAEQHVRVIDLLPEFRARALHPPELYLRGDGHWTASGHRLAAEIIVRNATKIHEFQDVSSTKQTRCSNACD